MSTTQSGPREVRFDNGAEYEDYMGRWSQLAGDTFLDWLAPRPGLRWADIGCGNGAFTEMLLERCAPLEVRGSDPSEGQLAFARTRPAIQGAPVQFQIGDATALPYHDNAFDAAVMALVIFFVPDPVKGVAEMARVVKPGGSVSAYAWDILGGGFPYAAMQREMVALGVQPLWPPSVEAARLDALRALWAGAGLIELETREIEVQRSFTDFDTYWQTVQTGPRMAPKLASMPPAVVRQLRDGLRTRLGADADGRITCSARANAIKGRLPG
jgi:SAM-dependent methyltransferase